MTDEEHGTSTLRPEHGPLLQGDRRRATFGFRRRRRPLVDALCDAIEARESVLLVGDSGAGKTCVLRALRQRLSQGSFRLTYCSNVTLGRRDFYRQLCVALGLTTKATAAAVFAAVSANIEILARERTHPVFLLDEAHLMHQDVLDHLHILMNFDWDSRALLSLVLVGLPDLADRLRLRRNRSLYTRLQHRFLIEPITPERCGGVYDPTAGPRRRQTRGLHVGRPWR